MSRSTRSPEEVLRALRDDVALPVEDAERADARRARVVASLSQHIAASHAKRTASRRFWMAGGVALAAAAAVALALGVASLRGGSPDGATHLVSTVTAGRILGPAADATIVDGADETLATDGAAVAPGARVRTGAAGNATLRTDAGVGLVVSGASEIALEGATAEGEIVGLRTGRVDVTVPPLEPGRSLRVVAPFAEIVVHGTRFSVHTAGDQAAGWTSVEVTEGTVVVRHAKGETRLGSGERWSSRDTSASAAEPRDDPAPTAEPVKSAPIGKPSSTHAALGDPSDLAEQNRIYQDAMASKRGGDDRATIARLESLLARFPTSPLAPEARQEIVRARKRLEAPK